MRLRTSLHAPLRRAGFTMLELIMAAAIASIFFLMVFSIVWSMVEARRGIEEKALPYAVAPAVLTRLTEDLRHAVAWPFSEGKTFIAEAENVVGEDVTKLHFVSAVPSRRKFEMDDEEVRAHINEIGWQCRRSETYDGLMALYRREDPGVDDEPLEGGTFQKVVDGVKGFKLDFFANDPGDVEGELAEGEEEWDASKDDGLPYGCRITLVIQPPAEYDADGNVVEPVPEELTFITYVAFPTRDARPARSTGPGTGSGTNPPSGN